LRGATLLKIRKITASCGCTVPTLSKKQYERGQEGVIKVKYKGKSKQGPVAEYIFVPTNDRENPKAKLTIRARVVQQVEVSPAKLQLSLSKENAGMPDITLKSRNGRPFSITGFTSSDKVVSVDFDPNATASKLVLKPEVDMEKLKEHHQGMIKIDLTHPRCRSAVLFYKVVPKFRAQPAKITLYDAEPNKPQIREILIRNTDNEQFEIESVSSKHGYIEVISQEPNGNNIKLKLQITPPPRKAKQGRFSDSLKIKIKSDEELAIPCTGFYRRVAKDKPTTILA